jgi:hypothetical protein
MRSNLLSTPRIRIHPDEEYGDFEPEAHLITSTASGRDPGLPFLSTYILVTLIALLAGYVLGQLGNQPSNGSRVGWPSAPANPRSLNP